MTKLANALARYGVVGTILRLPTGLRNAYRKSRLYDVVGARSVMSPYGVRLRSNWRDLTFEFYMTGTYGETLSTFLRTYPRQFVFLDIGANQGLYSLLAAKNANCAHVYAFEPVPETFSLLAENIALNRLSDRITPLMLGISNVDAEVSISAPDGHSGAASLQVGLATTGRVAVKSLASLKGDLMPLSVPIVAKVDVEGHETIVLSELASNVASRLEAVFYEVDLRWSDPGRLATLMVGAGLAHSRAIGSDPMHYDVLASRHADPGQTEEAGDRV